MVAADAIVILGCRIDPSGRPAPPAARRAAAGASAFLAGVAPRVIASGGRRWGSHIEARALRTRVIEAGVPAAAIVEELLSLSTRENAIFSAAILRRFGVSNAARPPRAVIVTCPWHMARALEDFRAAGVDALPFPTGIAEIPRLRRAYLEAHEFVCRRLDARAMARAEILEHCAACFHEPADESSTLWQPAREIDA